MIHDAGILSPEGQTNSHDKQYEQVEVLGFNHDKINYATSPDDFSAGFYYVKFVEKVKTLIVSSVNKVY